jgi:hypothetical protein
MVVLAPGWCCELPPIWPRITANGAPVTGGVSGCVTIEAGVLPKLKVTSVEFLVDDKVIGKDAEAPYSVVWDTTTVANGEHVVKAKAYLDGGTSVVSKPLKVTVANKWPHDRGGGRGWQNHREQLLMVGLEARRKQTTPVCSRG